MREIDRQLSRSKYHSISIGGRDPLANQAFLIAALEAAKPPVPVMLDTDGQRPETLKTLAPFLALAQVTVEFWVPDATLANVIETISQAAQAKCAHALVLCPRDDTSDGQLLRVIEQAHGVSADDAGRDSSAVADRRAADARSPLGGAARSGDDHACRHASRAASSAAGRFAMSEDVAEYNAHTQGNRRRGSHRRCSG